MTEQDECFEHCRQRASERYGFTLDRPTWEQLSRQAGRHVAKQKVLNIETNKNGTQYTLELAYYDEAYQHIFFVVFEDRRGCLTTFLPPEHFKSH